MLQQDVTFSDDSFDFDPSTLNQSSRMADGELPPPGYYAVKIVAGGVKKNRETGEMVRDKKGNPVFAIQRIAVVEPSEHEASIPVFQDLYTNGFQPKNWKTGETLPGPKVFPFIQCLAAIDDTLPTTDFNSNVHELARQLDAKPILTVRLGYTGTDKTYAKAQIAAGVDAKTAWRSAELKPGAFRNPDGTWRTSTIGPSGETVEAKMRITEYVRSSDTSKTLGPLHPRG